MIFLYLWVYVQMIPTKTLPAKMITTNITIPTKMISTKMLHNLRSEENSKIQWMVVALS